MLKKLITLGTLILSLNTSNAYANSLINNSASGVVSGSIIQESTGSSSETGQGVTIDVGSIITNGRSISNVNVSAYVDGNIVTQGSNTHISIGSFYGNQ